VPVPGLLLHLCDQSRRWQESRVFCAMPSGLGRLFAYLPILLFWGIWYYEKYEFYRIS